MLSLASLRAGTVRASVKRGSTFVVTAATRNVRASTRTLPLTLDRKLGSRSLHGQGDRPLAVGDHTVGDAKLKLTF